MTRWRKEPHDNKGNFRIYDEKNDKYVGQGRAKQQLRRYEHEIDGIIQELKERTGDH